MMYRRGNIWVNTCGASVVEFAMSLPLLILVSLGIYEVTTFIRINSKLNEAASNIAQWMAVHPSVANANDFITGFNSIGSEFDFTTKAKIMISGIYESGGNNKLAWNYGTVGATTTIVVSSGKITSTGFTMTSGVSNLVVTEVTYAYQPFFTYFTGILPTVTLYRTAQFIPKTTINPLPAT
jgi:Flp pilus assembly protein TadG